MNTDITCVILAGGRARRMDNADKALIQLDGSPLLTHVLNRINPQINSIIINANGDPGRFSHWQLPIVADTISQYPGPLAGVLAAMEWAKNHRPLTKWITTVPVDTPFIPRNLISRFLQSVNDENAEMACAKSNQRTHPVVGLWPVHLAKDLRSAIIKDDIRKVDLWTSRYKIAHTQFSTNPVDPFFNINRPDDINDAETILQMIK